MKSKQIFIFSDLEDLRSILHDFETNNNVQYYATGLFDNPDTTKYSSIFDITNLGISNAGDWNLCLNLLVIDKSDSVKIREVPQRKGGIKYAIDQMINPKSIVLKTGGIFKEGVLVAGAVGTISNDPYSNTLFNNLSKKIKKEFKKIGEFYVGPNAENKLDKGWRLVTNEKSPSSYDLKK